MEEAKDKKCKNQENEGMDSHTHTHRYVPVTRKDHAKHVEVQHVAQENVDRRYYPGGGHQQK